VRNTVKKRLTSTKWMAAQDAVETEKEAVVMLIVAGVVVVEAMVVEAVMAEAGVIVVVVFCDVDVMTVVVIVVMIGSCSRNQDHVLTTLTTVDSHADHHEQISRIQRRNTLSGSWGRFQ
jgi:hypothetical protein